MSKTIIEIINQKPPELNISEWIDFNSVQITQQVENLFFDKLKRTKYNNTIKQTLIENKNVFVSMYYARLKKQENTNLIFLFSLFTRYVFKIESVKKLSIYHEDDKIWINNDKTNDWQKSIINTQQTQDFKNQQKNQILVDCIYSLPLTKKDKKILDLIQSDYTYRKICDKLNVSYSYIKKLLSNIKNSIKEV